MNYEIEDGIGLVVASRRSGTKMREMKPIIAYLDDSTKKMLDERVTNLRYGVGFLIDYALKKLEEEKKNLREI
jgi:hypothetical protein